MATSEVLLFKGGAGVFTYKAVHTQGGAHNKQSVATAQVLLFRGCVGVSPASSEASRSLDTRRCIHRAVHIQGGAHITQCTQKAACGPCRTLVI